MITHGPKSQDPGTPGSCSVQRAGRYCGVLWVTPAVLSSRLLVAVWMNDSSFCRRASIFSGTTSLNTTWAPRLAQNRVAPPAPQPARTRTTDLPAPWCGARSTGRARRRVPDRRRRRRSHAPSRCAGCWRPAPCSTRTPRPSAASGRRADWRRRRWRRTRAAAHRRGDRSTGGCGARQSRPPRRRP